MRRRTSCRSPAPRRRYAATTAGPGRCRDHFPSHRQQHPGDRGDHQRHAGPGPCDVDSDHHRRTLAAVGHHRRRRPCLAAYSDCAFGAWAKHHRTAHHSLRQEHDHGLVSASHACSPDAAVGGLHALLAAPGHRTWLKPRPGAGTTSPTSACSTGTVGQCAFRRPYRGQGCGNQLHFHRLY